MKNKNGKIDSELYQPNKVDTKSILVDYYFTKVA